MPFIKKPVNYNKKQMVNTTNKTLEEIKESIEKWKKKAWLDFCKLVMESDTRYTLSPISDYFTNRNQSSIATRMQVAGGIFDTLCLTRTGSFVDTYILPNETSLGIKIDCGSKYNSLIVSCYPSKAMVEPILHITNELERQFIREVTIESNKHK